MATTITTTPVPTAKGTSTATYTTGLGRFAFVSGSRRAGSTLPSGPVFKYLGQRREARRHHQDQLVLQSVNQQGFDAHGAGHSCTPPAGYEPIVGFDLVGEWTAGWAQADREVSD
jgi:hypothetical protein